jgi:hypothetical protein
MPKKPTPDKKTRARNPHANTAFGKAPSSINDLLRRQPALTALAARIPAQQQWLGWLRGVLPEELRAHVVNVVARDLPGPRQRLELVVLADSSAWCERLRYALAGLAGQIAAQDAAVQHVRVRVSPG